VTVKKKFIDDALYNSTSLRVASVYVIVVNREKTFDPIINQKHMNSIQKNLKQLDTSDEEEEQAKAPKPVVNPTLIKAQKRSMYDSDTNGNLDNLNSTATSSNVPQFKKLIQDKAESEAKFKQVKAKGVSAGPAFKR